MIRITPSGIRALLPVQKHRIDEHLEMHAEILDQIAQGVTLANSRQLEAKDALLKVEARLATDAKEDDPKLTVAGVDSLVRRHADRTKAYLAYQRDRADFEEWSGLLEAWRSKGYSMKTLADLYSTQYFTLESFQKNDTSARGAAFSRGMNREASPPPPTSTELPVRRRSLL
jgi:hypothetical protein